MPPEVSSASGPPQQPSYIAFLSHRYKSPAVNLYFYDVFSRVAEIQFEVDEGNSPISMAKLTRMMRRAHAFIGIYPLPAASDTTVKRKDLLEASRYFRLELHLAVQAGLPIMVMHDERYRSILSLPSGVFREAYNVQEVLGKGGTPSEARFIRIFQDFCRAVTARMTHEAQAAYGPDRDSVGLLLHPGVYSRAATDEIRRVLEVHAYRVVTLPWPPSISASLHEVLPRIDWLILDTGDLPEGAAVQGWLEGQCVPILRLHGGDSEPPVFERALYGSFEVGYNEDVLYWQDFEELCSRLDEMAQLIGSSIARINTRQEATAYFQRAEQRKDRVFLSYSSAETLVAARVSEELKRKFEIVFDYKDGESMEGGELYPQQLYGKLGSSTVGVPILSKSYVEKGTCMHEAQDMARLLDSGRMFVFPLKVDDSDTPNFFRTLQFTPISESSDVELLVERIIKGYDDWLERNRK